MRSSARALTVAVIALVAPRASRAAELTDIASSFEEDNPFDLRLRVSYFHDEKRASVKREGQGPGQENTLLFKDLLHSRSRDWMSVRAEVGLFHDLSVSVDLPFYLRDQSQWRFDQSLGAGCVYPGGAGAPNCVNESNSTTIADNIVPRGGYDAIASRDDAPVGFPAGSDMLFRGPRRGGSGLDAFDTINIGAQWAPLSQKRDDTKPTWLIGFEGQISFGTVMKFDRTRPQANAGVSEGLHRLHFRTAISRRFKWVDPYVMFWYMLPIAREDSLFVDYGATQKNKGPQQSGGTVFGFEGIPWERPEHHYKIAIDVRGRIEGRFDGRGYSEAWEMLAGSPALACDPTWNPSCAPDPMDPMKLKPSSRYQGQPFTGLTAIENYASIGADIGVTVQAGRYVRFHAGFQYTHDQSHFITVDDVGKAFDKNQGDGCSVPIAARVSRACEFNPAYRPVINQIGRRYKVDNVDNFRFGLWAQGMF